jgi:capsular exopolysaccharide synthesis family protein
VAPPAREPEPAWDAETARAARPDFDPLLIAVTDPGSAVAEQYRLLRTRLEDSTQGPRRQVLLVTSPQIGDGKTTTSANLALTMAQEFQQTVLLVESDLRRPTLASLFAVPEGPGLVDVLLGAAPLEDAIASVPGSALRILPAGLPSAQSTELLGSQAMHRVMETLRAQFDRIVLDSPPVAIADTHVLARLVDGLLLVVRAGLTQRQALERALAGVDREKVVGVVLNEVADASRLYGYSYGDGYGYGYGYSSPRAQAAGE